MAERLTPTVLVPVSCIDRALELYRDCLAFTISDDAGVTQGPNRTVTLLAPGGVLSIRLQIGSAEQPAGSLREAVLPVRDLARTLGCLRWGGVVEHWVDPDAPGGAAALFADRDGNIWTLWQPELDAMSAAA
jgi:catechol 2,3-dioxygenase-like lactoylglutathione lyase family enzyme